MLFKSCINLRRAGAVGAICLSSGAWGVTPRYSLLDLQTLGGIKSEAWGLNNAGQVVGWSKMADGSNRAFLTSPNMPVNPATDAFPLLAGATANYAYAVNSAGQVAGDNTIAAGDRAYRLNSGTVSNLGTLGGTWSYAYDVNALGAVVGGAAKPKQGNNFPNHAFLYSGTTMFDLGTLGGQDSYAFGINATGKVIGYSQTSGSAALERGFIWTPSTSNGTTGTMTAIDTLGGSTSYAFGINDNGDIVGGAQTSLDVAYHAFLRAAGGTTLTDLGTLGGTFSEARAVNAAAVIVGNSDSPSGQRAFVYAGSVMRDLNALVSNLNGWTLTNAQDINDVGQIVGFGTNGNGEVHGYLLTPLPVWKVNADGSWSSAGNWLGAVPNSSSAEAFFTDAITSPRTVTANIPISVSRITFDNANSYTLAGPSTITFSGANADSGIRVVSGSHVIQAPLVASGTITLDVANGATLTINGEFNATATNAMTKSGMGVLSIPKISGAMFVASDGTTLIPPTSTPWQNSRTSSVATLLVAPGAKLDLGNSALVVDYTGTSPFDNVRGLIQSGYNAGAWTGYGIVSSSAAGDSARYAVGYAEASEFGTSSFAGMTFSGDAVLIAYALIGDTNLDGRVNTLDFNNLAGSFGSFGVWRNGDANYDMQIDSTDFNSLVVNYSLALPIAMPGPVTAVPEPVQPATGCALLWCVFRRVKTKPWALRQQYQVGESKVI